MVDTVPILARLHAFRRSVNPLWQKEPPEVRGRRLHREYGLSVDLAWFLAYAPDDLAALLEEVEQLRSALQQVYTGESQA